MLFRDRADAGRHLLSKLGAYEGRPDVLVLGLPRGGIPVGYEVARGLSAPLDVFVVRKLGVPGHPELAFGAIASGGVRVLCEEIGRRLDPWIVEAVTGREQAELKRRERAYRDDRPPLAVAGKIVVLVDDGLATGATMYAAVDVMRQAGAQRLIAAVPVGAPDELRELAGRVDEVAYVYAPDPFHAVGAHYVHFGQVDDATVTRELARAQERVS